MSSGVHIGKACAKRIVWVWAVRHYCELLSFIALATTNPILIAHINWLGTELKKTVTAIPDGVDLSIMIYVTTGTSTNVSATQTLNGHEQDVQEKDTDPEKDGDFDEKNSVEIVDTPAFDASLDMKDVTVVSGRPDIRKILEDSVTTSAGPVSVDGQCIRCSLALRRLRSVILPVQCPDLTLWSLPSAPLYHPPLLLLSLF